MHLPFILCAEGTSQKSSPRLLPAQTHSASNRHLLLRRTKPAPEHRSPCNSAKTGHARELRSNPKVPVPSTQSRIHTRRGPRLDSIRSQRAFHESFPVERRSGQARTTGSRQIPAPSPSHVTSSFRSTVATLPVDPWLHRQFQQRANATIDLGAVTGVANSL
jgi:hypothetical protein